VDTAHSVLRHEVAGAMGVIHRSCGGPSVVRVDNRGWGHSPTMDSNIKLLIIVIVTTHVGEAREISLSNEAGQ
jgi:hypothetical protein